MNEDLLFSPPCFALIAGVLIAVVAEILARKDKNVLLTPAKPKSKRRQVAEDDADLDELLMYGILDDMDRRDRRE